MQLHLIGTEGILSSWHHEHTRKSVFPYHWKFAMPLNILPLVTRCCSKPKWLPQMYKINTIFIRTLLIFYISSSGASPEQLSFPLLSHWTNLLLCALSSCLWTLIFFLHFLLFFFPYDKFLHLWDLNNFRKVLFIYWIKNSVGKEHTLPRTCMAGRKGAAESRARPAVMKKMTDTPHCKCGTERPWIEFKGDAGDFRENSFTWKNSL